VPVPRTAIALILTGLLAVSGCTGTVSTTTTQVGSSSRSSGAGAPDLAMPGGGVVPSLSPLTASTPVVLDTYTMRACGLSTQIARYYNDPSTAKDLVGQFGQLLPSIDPGLRPLASNVTGTYTQIGTAQTKAKRVAAEQALQTYSLVFLAMCQHYGFPMPPSP
jgi:hypothetical protein